MENKKLELYPYTHEYYFGFFKSKSMVNFIRNIIRYDSNYTFEFFSLKLYENCKEKNIKPSRQGAKYVLQNEWRKVKRVPKNMTDNAIKELNEHITLIEDENIVDESNIIYTVDTYNLTERIKKYVKETYSDREQKIFEYYFIENIHFKEIEKLLNLKKSSLYLIINKIKNDLKEKFYKDYNNL